MFCFYAKHSEILHDPVMFVDTCFFRKWFRGSRYQSFLFCPTMVCVCVGGGGEVFKPIVTNTSIFHQFEINISTCVTKVGCPFLTCRTLSVNFKIGPEEYYCNCNLKNGQSCFNFFSESYRTKKNMLFNEAEKFNSMFRKSSNLSKDEKPHAYPLWSKGEMIEVNNVLRFQ